MSKKLFVERSLAQQRGDTIIEVLIAVAVVGSILGTVFVSMNRGTESSRASQEHEEALQVAQAQLEYLASYVSDNPAVDMTPKKGFCMHDSIASPGVYIPTDFGVPAATPVLPATFANYGTCNSASGGATYYYGILHDVAGSYYVHVDWDGPTGHREDVNLAYKIF